MDLAPTGPAVTRRRDDDAMLRAAVDLTRDVARPDPRLYWTDMLGSAALGYAGLALAMLSAGGVATAAGLVVAIFALYRAGSFIHELTHVKHDQLRGFRLGWNLAVGIPLLVPSFLYEGVHTLHHARTRYGTALDPEYLPLARMRPWSLPLFVAVAALAPVVLLMRFAVLAPLGLLMPVFRRRIVAAFSALAINSGFRRKAVDGAAARAWRWQEAASGLWAIAFCALAIGGIAPLRMVLLFLGALSGIAVVNQVRTLVAHLWENEGEAMTVTEQYLDSVNVPPPGLLPALWAPVGLRYHALHHLLPSLPYHALGIAHRRLATALDERSSYHPANHRGLGPLTVRLVKGTLGRGGPPYSSVRISTASPTSRNSRNGAQAARTGG